MEQMKQIITKACAICIVGTIVIEPVTAVATSKQSINDVVTVAGVSTLLTDSLSEEEYIAKAEDAVGAFWGYTNIGIANVDKNLNVRKEPSTDGGLVGKMPNNAACEVLEIVDDWAKIISGEVEGYVHTDYLYMDVEAKLIAKELAKPTVIVEVDALKVREEGNLESEVIILVSRGTELEYVATHEDWIQVDIDGEEAYVASEFVTLDESLSTAITLTEARYGIGVSDVRVAICEYALQFLGNPYVWGGTSLTNGADCSGFVYSVFKNYGHTLPRSSSSQVNVGTAISYSQLQPGDLIFYTSGGSVNHVALYIGDGKVIHASSPSTGIKISNYNYRTPYRYVSIL